MTLSSFYATSAFMNGLAAVFLVGYVYLRNPRHPVNKSFLYFGTAVGGWSIFLGFWAGADTTELAIIGAKRHLVFESFIPATFFHFVINFVEKQGKFSVFRNIFYALGFIYAAASATPLMIAGVRSAGFFEYWPYPGPLLLSHVIYFAVVVLLSFILMTQRLFEISGFEREQALWVLSAFVIGFGGGATNWFLWFDIPIPPLTNFTVGITFAMLAYAIVRYRLMDVDAVADLFRSSRAATLGLIASSVNHEIRNPFFIIKGRVDAHMEALDQDVFQSKDELLLKTREVLASAHFQLERVMGIMQRYSRMARPAAEQESKENVRVSEVVSEVLALVAPETKWKNILIEELPDSEIFIYGNRGQIEEIFFNLILNACHAMEEGGGTLAVRARKEKGKILIEVEDTGPGIPDSIKRRIFEPFYSTKSDKGTGLGLFITKQLVEKNGGGIEVKQVFLKGAIFRVMLPVPG